MLVGRQEYKMLYLDEIAQFLDCFFAVNRFSEAETGGVFRPSNRRIKKLGLALEPWSNLQAWSVEQQLDALFLHRPWRLEEGQLPSDVGILSYHLPFDERLTLGFNDRLAQVLTMSALEVLGKKENRPIGMIGKVSVQDFTAVRTAIKEVFGGFDAIQIGDITEVQTIAVVGAMTDALVREAALGGADVYITGQLRKPAHTAVLETGINVIAVGHRRCEEWGLRSLAGVLRERWYDLEVFLPL